MAVLDTLTKYLGLATKLMPIAGQVPAALEIVGSIVVDVHAALSGGAQITPEQLAAAEQQTSTLMAQIDSDVKGLGTAGQL